MHLTWDILSLIAGFAILIYSSHIVVDNAIVVAEAWGVAQSLIGVAIVGLGTSLPEIAISLAAIRKGAFRLSVGNLLGANIADILFAVGLGGAISGLIVNNNLLWFDIPALFIVSALALFFFRTNKKIAKKEAIILIGVYLAYIVLKLKGF